jgi:hypothetical protein
VVRESTKERERVFGNKSLYQLYKIGKEKRNAQSVCVAFARFILQSGLSDDRSTTHAKRELLNAIALNKEPVR